MAGEPAGSSPGPRPRRSRRLGLLLASGGALALLSAFVGTVSIPPATVGAILLHGLTLGAYPADACGGLAPSARLCHAYTEIILESRLPAIFLAVLAGAALGLAGASLQGLFRNPLVDPYLLGLSAGGSIGAASLYVLGFGLAFANLALPLLAFLGTSLTGIAILAISGGRRGSVESLLLTGVALGYLLSGVLSFMLLYNPFGSLQVSFWLLGGLSGATWDRDGIALGGLLVAGPLLALYGRELNLLQLGPEVAQSLGVDARRARVRIVLLASLVTAMAVAFTGVIGFVGLVSPHIVRRLIGNDYRLVPQASALVGGVYLLVSYDVSELILPGVTVPVGILTAFTGAPFFLYLLHRRRRAEKESEGTP